VIVTVYWVILMRTIGMGELEEIGRVVGRLGMVFFIHMNILD
jgi:hypothetical protein